MLRHSHSILNVDKIHIAQRPPHVKGRPAQQHPLQRQRLRAPPFQRQNHGIRAQLHQQRRPRFIGQLLQQRIIRLDDFRQTAETLRDARIEFRQIRQRLMPQPVAEVGRIEIGTVEARLQPALAAIGFDFGAGKRQQGTNQPHGDIRRRRRAIRQD